MREVVSRIALCSTNQTDVCFKWATISNLNYKDILNDGKPAKNGEKTIFY